MASGEAKIHPNKEAFIEGVDHILAKWTALELAVQNGWGGRSTQKKRENMVDEVVEYFDRLVQKRQAVESTELEELLVDIMGEDFNVMLEDGSEKEVADRICQIFEECKQGNFATVDRLADERDAREAKGAGGSAASKSQAAQHPGASNEDNDLSDSDDGGSSSSSESDAPMQE
ncbi:Pre-rRNA-processing protein TSR2-domain-containing protein [Coemansia spiralis]|nr:Pre-rRNA-processing protein TSR2-domain-containing protein [Coemansia spiralis]